MNPSTRLHSLWSGLDTAVRRASAPWLVRAQALPERDRLALVGCLVAVLLAVEWLVIQPISQKRQTMAGAEASNAQAAADTLSQESAAQQSRLLELTQRAANLERELAGRGISSARGEALSALLERALKEQNVAVVSLRNLSSQLLPAGAGADANTDAHGAGAAPAAADAAQAGASAPAPAALYRHRYELTLGGEALALTHAAQALESGLAPARIERVRLLPDKAASLHLIVNFATLGTERAWLSL